MMKVRLLSDIGGKANGPPNSKRHFRPYHYNNYDIKMTSHQIFTFMNEIPWPSCISLKHLVSQPLPSIQ